MQRDRRRAIAARTSNPQRPTPSWRIGALLAPPKIRREATMGRAMKKRGMLQ
jgi:hypothetical protein